jgi:hypothetical protein
MSHTPDALIKRRILIDASRDGGVWWFPQAGPFVDAQPHQGHALASHLRGLGNSVTELPRPTTITPSLLAGYDIVIRVAGDGPYTPAELAAYHAWVSEAGRLLLLAEFHAATSAVDALAVHFGLHFRGVTRGQNMLSTFAPHPVTAGVTPLPYGVGSGLTAHPPSATVIGWLSGATYLDLNDDGVRERKEPAAPAALGVMSLGKGKIVFCGDANLWLAVPQPLVNNTLHWFAVP